jgi:hypothetical protein
LPKLVRYFQWWRTTRDSGDGLVSIIHNWESGLDASPAYDQMFHVNVTLVDQKSFWQLYPKFVELSLTCSPCPFSFDILSKFDLCAGTTKSITGTPRESWIAGAVHPADLSTVGSRSKTLASILCMLLAGPFCISLL